MIFPHWFTVLLLSLSAMLGSSMLRAEDLAWPTEARPGELGRQVNSFIGTGGITFLSGNNFPGATCPFGMVRLSPDTISPFSAKPLNTSGYYYSDQQLLGFSHTRLVGTGAIDGGNFRVVPATIALTEDLLVDGERLSFTHDQETAFPGYYAVLLPETGVIAELTTTVRVGVHRYTFAANQTPHIRLHVSSVLGKGRSTEAEVRVVEGGLELEGAARTFGSFSSRYGGAKIFFVAQFNTSIAGHTLWQNQKLKADSTEAKGDQVSIDLQFPPTRNPTGQTTQIELRLGISYVSIDNARENLNKEVGTKNFDQIVNAAKQEWEDKLAKARVDGGSPEQQTIYYSALYRSMNTPTTFSDTNGQYVGFDRQVHQAEQFTYYTDMSLWDTFRTTHPLYTLILPDEQLDIVRSLVAMSRQGGYLPRWPSGSGYTNSMFGTPADLVVAETYLKGIRDFDVQAAYAAMKRTALTATPEGAAFSGREGIDEYIKYQYCPHDLMRESVARTLEYCCADYAIARLAEALGHESDAAMFDTRAKFYRNLWNSETRYFQPKDSQGKFLKDFRPLLLTYLDFRGKHTSAYVEGSALQWRWSVPHDPEGLISLFSSRGEFIKQLEEFFSRSIPRVGALPNAYYWHGNQPDLFAAFLFNSAGRPDLTQKWVRWILQHKYGPEEDGLDGNDDGGTLSAWYVFGSLGLYPVAGTDRYELASPLWSRAELAVGSKPLVIIADNAAPDHIYVRRVLLNGQPITGTQLRHSQLVSGGELHFEMSGEAP